MRIFCGILLFVLVQALQFLSDLQQMVPARRCNLLYGTLEAGILLILPCSVLTIGL
jgi:hypothetical protein